MAQAERAGTPAGSRQWLQLSVVSLAVLLVAIDGTVLDLAIPAYTRALRPSATQSLWILDIYSLVIAGLLITAGTVSDRFGRKRVLLIGCSIFTAASALAAFSPTPEVLIGARVLMAFGGATIMPSTLALIRNIFVVDRERQLAIGVWSAMVGAGAAVGPILGGALLETFWWGSVFLINVPVLIVLLIAGGLVLPEYRDPQPGRLDPISVGLSVAALLAVAFAIKSLAQDGITSLGAAILLVGVGVGVAFVRRQRALPNPLVDVSLFRRASFSGAVIGNLLALAGLAGVLLFLSQLLQLVDGYSPLQAGLRLVPLTVGVLIAAPMTASMISRFGLAATVSTGLGAGGIAMLGFALSVGQGYLPVLVCMLLLGAGVGIALTATSDAIVAAAPPSKAGAASAISETSYELGTGIGIAVLGSVLAGQYAAQVPVRYVNTFGEVVRESLASALQVAQTVGTAPGRDLVTAARSAFTTAVFDTSLVSAGLLLAAAISSAVLLRRRPTPALHAPTSGTAGCDGAC